MQFGIAVTYNVCEVKPDNIKHWIYVHREEFVGCGSILNLLAYLLTYLLTYLFTYLLTYLLTAWNRVLLEKLSDSAASQEIPRIFGTRMFLTVPTSARHLSLS